jgi:hypothetical protein
MRNNNCWNKIELLTNLRNSKFLEMMILIIVPRPYKEIYLRNSLSLRNSKVLEMMILIVVTRTYREMYLRKSSQRV